MRTGSACYRSGRMKTVSKALLSLLVGGLVLALSPAGAALGIAAQVVLATCSGGQ